MQADQHFVRWDAVDTPDNFRLSTFPGPVGAKKCARNRLVGALQHVETLPVSKKRIMFATLRGYVGTISADHVLMQTGVTVGELTTGQLMFCTRRFSRKPRNM
jgi:hypothetical protein